MLKNLFNKTNQGEPTIAMADATIEDPTAWMIDNSIAQFVLMPTSGIVYMCMFAYTFVHGKYINEPNGIGEYKYESSHTLTSEKKSSNVSHFFLFLIYLSMYRTIGCKVFKGNSGPVSKMLIQLVLTCTGGGILVPIFLNGVPVSFLFFMRIWIL